MRTTSSLLKSIFLLVLISGCNSSTISDNKVYHFDYKLQPESSYSTSAYFYTNGKKKLGMANVITTGSPKDSFLSHRYNINTASTDSIYTLVNFEMTVSDYVEIPVEDQAVRKLLPRKEDVSSMVLNGYSLDEKYLEISNTTSTDPNLEARKQSNYKGIIKSTNPWQFQSDYPSGPMMIGDTFRIAAKRLNSTPTTFYILRKVKDSIAHFTLEDEQPLNSYSKIKKRKSKGTLTYDLTEDYYKEYKHFYQIVSEGKSSMHKQVRSIEKDK